MRIFILPFLISIFAFTLNAERNVKIVGGVNYPGEYTLTENEGIFDLIVKAGGFLEGSGGDWPQLHRNGGAGEARVVFLLDTRNLIREGMDVALEADDVISVAECVGLGLGGLWGEELEKLNRGMESIILRNDRRFIDLSSSEPDEGGNSEHHGAEERPR